jgi:hypothetical protein
MVADIYGPTSRLRVKEVAFIEVNFIVVPYQQSREMFFTNKFPCIPVQPNNGLTVFLCSNIIIRRKADVVTSDGVWTET